MPSKKLDAETGLTELQEGFCQQFLVDLQPKAAAVRAGYSPKVASVKAHHMLKTEKILKRISYLKALRMRRLTLSQDDVLRSWAEIGMFDIRELYHSDGRMKKPHELSASAAQVVSGMKVKQSKVRTYRSDTENEDGEEVEEFDVHIEEVVEYKTNDKHTALTNMAKHLGMLNDTVEHDLAKEFKELLGSLNPTMGPESAREKDITPSHEGPNLLPAPSGE